MKECFEFREKLVDPEIMRVARFLILGIFVCSSAFSGEVIDMDAYRKQKSHQEENLDLDDLPSEFGQRPKGGGNQKVYEEAYWFAITPNEEGGLGIRSADAHDWASGMAKYKTPQEFAEWRKRYWTVLEFSLKKGDEKPIASGKAKHFADTSTSKVIDGIIAKHYGWSRPFYKFGEKFSKRFESSQTPGHAIAKSDRAPGQVIELRPAPASAASATAAPTSAQVAECVKSMINIIFDSMGLLIH